MELQQFSNLVQSNIVRNELRLHASYARYFDESSLTPSFISSLKKLELIVSIISDYQSPQDVPEHVNNQIFHLKQSIPNFQILWNRVSNLITKDQNGVYLDIN